MNILKIVSVFIVIGFIYFVWNKYWVTNVKKQGMVIILNGASSVGKTSIAQELKKTTGKFYELVSRDGMIVDNDFQILREALVIYFEQKFKRKLTEEEINWIKTSDISMLGAWNWLRPDKAYIERKLATSPYPWLYIQDFGESFFNIIENYIFSAVCKRIDELAVSGKNLIVDLPFFHDIQMKIFFHELKNLKNILLVCVYCPFKVLIERIETRNKSKDQMAHRDFKLALTMYSKLFKAGQKGSDCLEILSRNDVIATSEIARKEFFGDDEQFNKFRNEIFENLSLQDDLSSVCIVPRLTYDCIVDTSKLSPKECAEQILNSFIYSGKNSSQSLDK